LRSKNSGSPTLSAAISSIWTCILDDLDAIRSFAGADHEAAVDAEEAREVLVRFDERVSHYQVVVDA
jgi:hypothetical protein